jgi:hypothetical protein
MSLKLSSQESIRIGARESPIKSRLRDRHRQLRTWLKKSDELILYDLSIVPAGSKPMHLLMTIRFRELDQRDSPIARTIPLSSPAKTN